MKEITRCGECILCDKDMTVAKSISGEEKIVNVCWLLRRCVEKDDGCTFGLPKGGDEK